MPLYGALGVVSGTTWSFHNSAPTSKWGDNAYQAAIVSREGDALVGNFTLIISIPDADVNPLVGMFLSPTARASDLKFYEGNDNETWNPAWYSAVYCLNALNTYNTGTAYRTGIHWRYDDSGGVYSRGNKYRFTRSGTALTVESSSSTSGPWSEVRTGACNAADKVLCIYGSAKGYGPSDAWVATVVSVVGG